MPVQHKGRYGLEACANLCDRGRTRDRLESGAAPANGPTGVVPANRLSSNRSLVSNSSIAWAGDLLTGEGEQCSSDCRGLSELRQRGRRAGGTAAEWGHWRAECGGLPQLIEGIFSDFLRSLRAALPRCAGANGREVGTAEVRNAGTGRSHLGQRLAHAVQPGDRRFASHPLEPVELLAACHPPLTRARQSNRYQGLAS